MLIDLFDTKQFIVKNDLREVTDPIIFMKGQTPSPNGLLSTDIFGNTINSRKETYAYIDLHSYFLHPYIYKLLTRLNRNFSKIVNSTANFIIKDGELIQDENGETGLPFLYKNWDKINFTKNDSTIRNTRIDVLQNYNKNELFTRYWIVIPAFYRDVNFQNTGNEKLSHHELNDKYSKLIRLTSLIDEEGSFDFVLSATIGKIQASLVDIYDYLKGKLDRKDGMIRRNLMGKSIDYASRLVISAPTFHAERPEAMTIDFYHAGVPLSHCCALFNPFIVKWVKDFFTSEFEKAGNKIPYKNSKGEVSFLEVDEPQYYFTEEFIKKEITAFIRNFSGRFKVIEVPVKNHTSEFVKFSFIGREYVKNKPMSESTIINRPATWCDILYQAAVSVTSDKHVYITRYPITDYFSLFPNRIHVESTYKTMPVIINDTIYETYPYVDLDMSKEKISTFFKDTMSYSNLYLSGMGADYDGDQVSVRAVFSQEANAEAERIMLSKTNIITIDGKNMRKSGNESVQTLYELTAFKKR